MSAVTFMTADMNSNKPKVKFFSNYSLQRPHWTWQKVKESQLFLWQLGAAEFWLVTHPPPSHSVAFIKFFHDFSKMDLTDFSKKVHVLWRICYKNEQFKGLFISIEEFSQTFTVFHIFNLRTAFFKKNASKNWKD